MGTAQKETEPTHVVVNHHQVCILGMDLGGGGDY